MSTPEESVQTNAASPEDVESAVSSRDDPDTIPAGGVQATTTAEAQTEARKILGRIGQREGDASQLRKDIEENAEASRSALIRAQKFLLQNYGMTMPSESELQSRQAAAMMAPHPGVGMAGAPEAMGASFQTELAAEEAQKRESMAKFLTLASGEPLQESMNKINQASFEARRKLLDLMQKSDTGMGRAAMTALGRMVSTPGAQSAIKPNSPEGKQALDELGPAAYVNPGDPTSGFSDAYRKRTKDLVATGVAEKKARAGIDVEPETVEQKIAAANAAGVPFAPDALPDISHMSTRQQTQFYQGEAAEIRKHIDQNGSDDELIRQALRNLDHFQSLNAVTATGPKYSPKYIGGVHAGPHGAGVDLQQDHGGFDVNPYSWFASFNSNMQAMQKDAASVVAMAIPSHGFGRVTNRDLALFQSASIGTDKNKDTNDAVAQALRIRLQNDLDRHIYEQSYAARHHTLQGAEVEWDKYLNANPIFDDPKKYKGQLVPPLNPHRTDWRTWFRSQNPQIEEEGDNTIEPEALSAADTLPAREPHAEGGSIHMAEGGDPPASPPVTPQPDSDVSNTLKAFINGLSLKGAGYKEDPNSPGENFLGELGGGATTTLAALAALRRPARLARLISEHPHLAASGVGGLTGFVSGEMGGGDPLTEGGGAAILAPLVAAAGRGAYRPLMRLTDELTRSAGPGVRKSLDAINADSGGNWDKVAGELQQDAKQKIPSILGEVAGPRSRGLTRAAIYKDTPESSDLLGGLQERQAEAPERVGERVNQALAPDDYLGKTEELREALYTKAAPLYDQAFSAFPSLKTQALQQIMGTPAGQEAATRAFISMKNKMLPIGAADATGMVQNPSLQYLDQVKRQLDGMITREEGVGPNYQANENGRDLRNLRKSLVDEMDKATIGPQGQPSPYRAARDQYAGDLEVMDALRSGREDFDRLTPAEIRNQMQNLDFSSRDAFRSGVAEGIFQKIGNLGPNRNAAQTIINNPNVQQKLMAIFDNPAEAQKFISSLQREAEIFGSGQMLTKQGEQGQLRSMQPSSISTMLRGQLMRPSTAGQVSETMGLTANDPQAKEKLARLRDIADRLRSQKGVSSLLGTATAGGSSIASTPSSMQDQQP